MAHRPRLHASIVVSLCVSLAGSSLHASPKQSAPAHPQAVVPTEGTEAAPPPPAGLSVATFAGGCFWCMEAAFEQLHGVRDVISGYTGGTQEHPTYEAVSDHRTTHAESIRVIYDPHVVTYEQLLDAYWQNIDPTDPDQAFSDTGHQYRSAIFVHDATQRTAAEHSVQAINASHRFERPVLVRVENAGVFWMAEAEHQNFWRTHPDVFRDYHEHSGRREYIRGHWGPNATY